MGICYYYLTIPGQKSNQGQTRNDIIIIIIELNKSVNKNENMIALIFDGAI